MINDLTCKNLEEIKIEAQRISFFAEKGTIRIINNYNSFVMCYYFSGGRPHVDQKQENVIIDKEVISEFITAITQPFIKKPEIFNLQIVYDWINFYSEVKGLKCNIKINDTLHEKLKSNTYLQKRLSDVLWRRGFGKTNDYPRLKIIIKYKGGQKIEITSDEQRDFMVPWVIKFGDNSATTANIRISQSILRLIPVGFTNSDKLLGDKFMLERLELKI